MKNFFLLFIPVLFKALIGFSTGFPSLEERPDLACAYQYFYGQGVHKIYADHQNCPRETVIEDLKEKAEKAHEIPGSESEIITHFIAILTVFPKENGLDQEPFERLRALVVANPRENPNHPAD